MKNLIPVDELFLPKNIQSSFGKAIDILSKIDGDSIDEKLENISNKYNSLTIKDIHDKENYEVVHAALLDIQKVRVAIKKIGKNWRDSLTTQSREELHREKELLALFENTETKLRIEKNRIDDLKIIEERRVLLPVRNEMLSKIDEKVDEDKILLMDEKAFADYYQELKRVYDDRKEQERQEKIAKLHNERYKEIVESGLFEYLDDKYAKYGDIDQKTFEKVIKTAKENKNKKEAERKERLEQEAEKRAEQARQEAEEKRRLDIEKVKEQARLEKQKLIDKQKKQEQERKEEIDKEKREKEQERLAELEAKERAEKNKKYQQWKEKNNYNPDTDTIKRNGDTFTMLRVISTINL